MVTDDDPRPDALALADRFDARAAALETEAADLRWRAGVLRGKVSEETGRVEAAVERALTIGAERVIDSHEMQASVYAAHAKVTGRPSESDHPFPRALQARKPPISVAQWAVAHGLTRQKVMSWLIDGAGARRIPKKYADEIRREFQVPLGAWTNGIRED